MKLLGLDIGDRRIGAAFAETDLKLATPLEVISRTNMEQDVLTLQRLIKEYEPEKLIIGLPRNMDGSMGGQATSTVAFGEQLGQAVRLPVVFWDERLSTNEAVRRIQASGGYGKKTRRALDAIAAAVILQDYMDAQEDSTTKSE